MWVRQHNCFILTHNEAQAAFIVFFFSCYRKLSQSDAQKNVVYQFAKLFSTYFGRYEELTPETVIAKNINKLKVSFRKFCTFVGVQSLKSVN